MELKGIPMIEPYSSAESRREESALQDTWKHLRILYQLTLAPIFLWGYLLAAPIGWRLLPAFIAVHFLLYPGITAFNSYYDRDRGPIGGLRNPPPVSPILLRVGIALKAGGLVLALPLGISFTLIYAAFVCLSVLYSHPRFRWKADPWLSAAIVGFGQGGLGFLAGWAAGGGSISGVIELVGVQGMVSAILTALGMYPLTQLFQVEEDSARGDRTICVSLGKRRALRVSQAAFLLGGIAAMAALAQINTISDSLAVGAGYVVLIGICEWLVRTRLDGAQTFRLITGVSYGSSAMFAAMLLIRVARWG
jgi:1,4-dihydroxy-2-naphthoate octaprenyltransferase